MDISEEKLNDRFDKIESMIESLALSTKKGLDEVRNEIQEVESNLRTEIQTVDSNLRTELQKVKLEILDKTISSARFGELEGRISDIETLLANTKIKSI